MKKIGVLFVLTILFFNLIFIQADLEGVEKQVDDQIKELEKAEDILEKSQDQKHWEQTWDYLGKEWQKIILKNQFAADIDSIFAKFSIVFSIFLGVEYSLSLSLFFIFVIWLFFFLNLIEIISATGLLREEFSWVGTLLINVILAQTGFFKNLVIFLGNFIFAPDYVWTRAIIFFVVILAFYALNIGDKKLAAYLRLSRKKRLEREAEITSKAIVERERSREEVSKLGEK